LGDVGAGTGRPRSKLGVISGMLSALGSAGCGMASIDGVTGGAMLDGNATAADDKMPPRGELSTPLGIPRVPRSNPEIMPCALAIELKSPPRTAAGVEAAKAGVGTTVIEGTLTIEREEATDGRTIFGDDKTGAIALDTCPTGKLGTTSRELLVGNGGTDGTLNRSNGNKLIIELTRPKAPSNPVTSPLAAARTPRVPFKLHRWLDRSYVEVMQ
jgi:hypothetical protein